MMTRSATNPVVPHCRMTAEHRRLDASTDAVAINLSRFRGASGVTEWHLTVIPRQAGSLEEQLGQVEAGYREAMAAAGLDCGTAVWRRFFCSDIANQAEVLRRHPMADGAGSDNPCAVSLVGEAPLAAAKVALWAYHVSDPAGALDKSMDGGTLTLRRGSMRHLWSTGLASPDEEGPYAQTRAIFAGYVENLEAAGLTLYDNVVRTWLFQPHIDVDYRGMVDARREFFAEHGLTGNTHFIASTGIGGEHPLSRTRVFMDAYAVGGLSAGQVAYLAAPDCLGPTCEYGVTFERAAAVAYRDRKHVFISGTASIDPDGEIVHPGDVLRQLDRTLGNIDGLLADGGATLADMLVFVVYLRDPGDHARVLPLLRERIGDAPLMVVAGSVCRPGWLIEIEGVATVAADLAEFPPY